MAGKQLGDFHFGIYTAKLDIVWGETNQTDKNSYVFFIIPWQLLTIVLILIVILGFASRKFIRRYNRWIISQARSGRVYEDDYEERPRRRAPVLAEKRAAPTVKKRVVRKKDE